MEETGNLREGPSVVDAQHSRTVVREQLEIVRNLEDLDLCEDDGYPSKEEEKKGESGSERA